MTVNLLALLEQCRRFGVEPDSVHSEVTAHRLLDRLQADPRVHLEWALSREWQLTFDGEVVHVGSFEDCVTWLAAYLR